MTTGQRNRRIRATVSGHALEKVTRMFDGSESAIATELLQNARRAGATRVQVDVHEEPPGTGTSAVTVRDDGEGVADPALLLRFGESGWSRSTCRNEDPAGFGMVALARHEVIVESARETNESGIGTGWGVVLTPEVFAGQTETEVVPLQRVEGQGTTLRWRTTTPPWIVAEHWQRAARHAPIPVAVNGREAPRADFLETAIHRAKRGNARIGVIAGSGAYQDGCWHGLAIRLHMPVIETLDGECYATIADVSGVKGLELVLPARREVVENETVGRIRDAAATLLAQTMRRCARKRKTPLRLSHGEWSRLARTGITVDPTTPTLRPCDFTLAVQQILEGRRHDDAPAQWEAVATTEAVIVPNALWQRERALCAMLSRRIDHPEGGPNPTLWWEETAFAGFDWYDALPRIRRLEAWAEHEGRFEPLEHQYDEGFTGGEREQLWLKVDLQRPQADIDTLWWPIDLAWEKSRVDWTARKGPALARGTQRDVPEIATALCLAYFHAHYDVATHGSYAEQHRRCLDEACELAERTLLTPHEQIAASLERLAERHLLRLVPKGTEATVHIANATIRQIEISGTERYSCVANA